MNVEVTGAFGSPGEPAKNITYRVRVDADAPQGTIDDLIRTNDTLTEIQNTLRAGCAVRLEQACVQSPANRSQFPIANSKKKRDPANRSHHASLARSAVGRFASKTNGFAPAASSGTHSTLEESAQRACINGLKRSASLAVDGRRIPIGMRTEQMSMGGTPTLSFLCTSLNLGRDRLAPARFRGLLSESIRRTRSASDGETPRIREVSRRLGNGVLIVTRWLTLF